MTYHLQIVTADGTSFDGEAEKLTVRTTMGDVCILPRHINYATALGMGRATIVVDGKPRHAACVGGMLSVNNGDVKLLPTTFEWQEDIDIERAKQAEATARDKLAEKARLSDLELDIAEAKLKRSLVRQGVAMIK